LNSLKMYLLYLSPSTGKTGSASSVGNLRRIKMDACGAGEASADDMSVGQLREKIAEVLASQNQSGHGFKMIHCGKILKDETKKLKEFGISARSSIQVIPTLADEEAAAAKPVAPTGEDLQQSFVAFTLAARNPNFTQTVAKASKNFEDMCATVPGLDQDPIACAFLSKPELMLSLKDQETFKYVAEKHPGLIEVANNLAALILESKPSADKDAAGGEAAAAAASNPFAYHLDDMSDDDYDDDDDAMDTGEGGAAGAGAAQPFQPISADQLRAALSAATGSFSGNPFGGVTGMGPAARPAATASSSTMQSPITQDQLAAALAAATGGSSSSSAAMTPGAAVPSSSSSSNPFSFLGGATAAAPPQQASGAAGNWAKEVAKMKEMGISDEGLARKALQVMGGDIQAAIELIFSGWDGKDDTSN